MLRALTPELSPPFIPVEGHHRVRERLARACENSIVPRSGRLLLGLVLVCLGVYLLGNQVLVRHQFAWWWNTESFGIGLVLLVVGVGLVFFHARWRAGWILALLGAALIFAEIVASLRLYFQPTSLLSLVVMLVLLFGGIGLVARSIRPFGGT